MTTVTLETSHLLYKRRKQDKMSETTYSLEKRAECLGMVYTTSSKPIIYTKKQEKKKKNITQDPKSKLNTKPYSFIFYQTLLFITDSFFFLLTTEKGLARFKFEPLFRLCLMLLKSQPTFIAQGIHSVNGK